jgi:type IV secretory pathway VirB10-like protein
MTQIESPSGIDLAPEPPPAVRISKRAGLVAVLALAGVVALVLLGMYARHEKQMELSRRSVEEQKPTAAMPAEKELVSEIAPATAGEPFGSSESRAADSRNPKSSASRKSADLKVPELKPPLEYREGGRSNQAGGQPELSAEEKLRAQAYQREQEAIVSFTLIKATQFRSGDIGNPPSRAENDVVSQLGALSKAATSREGGSLGDIASALRADRLGAHGIDYEQQNQQAEKAAFLEKASASLEESYLKSTRARPLGKLEVKAGWDIPATLEQAVTSDLPGEVKALVRSNVYDTASGKYLLIPQGARLVGAYNSRIAYGQRGVQVIWYRIIYPDGTSINLEGMTGYDAKGNSGFRFDVDNHYKRLMGFAVLTSLFAAGVELAQNGTGGTSVFNTPTAGQTAAAAVGQQLGELGVEVTRRNLNVQPTIKIPIGYRFNVRVNRDILFDAPYQPVEM